MDGRLDAVWEGREWKGDADLVLLRSIGKDQRPHLLLLILQNARRVAETDEQLVVELDLGLSERQAMR